ncbi:hypothetical protein L1887_62973 [Cichorium endivia]|nr:hypothetical protein L1887_62973 [Cichorium endivia]
MFRWMRMGMGRHWMLERRSQRGSEERADELVALSLVQQLCMTSRLRASNHTRQPLLGSLEGAKAPFRVLPQLAIESTTGSARLSLE